MIWTSRKPLNIECLQAIERVAQRDGAVGEVVLHTEATETVHVTLVNDDRRMTFPFIARVNLLAQVGQQLPLRVT